MWKTLIFVIIITLIVSYEKDKVVRHGSQIRPHEAAAGRSLAPALHSKTGLTMSRTHEEYVLT